MNMMNIEYLLNICSILTWYSFQYVSCEALLRVQLAA